jgi:lysozyme family protein
VLAAEAFAVPARDPSLRSEPIQLPDDPTGIAEPHDILAAEEFALPAACGAKGGISGALARRAQAGSSLWVVVAAVVVALILLRRSKT